MNLRRFIVMGALLAWAPLGWPVSRVGTGKVSNEENGFVASIPPGYSNFIVASNQNLSMEGGLYFKGLGSPERRRLMVYLLSNQQPRWVGRFDRAEFAEFFESAGWLRVAHRDPCVEQFEKSSGSGFTRVLSWGGGMGAIVASPEALSDDVKVVADTLEIAGGFCSWK